MYAVGRGWFVAEDASALVGTPSPGPMRRVGPP